MPPSLPIEMRLVDSISQVDLDSWNRIRDPDHLFTSPDYLKAVEAANALACHYRYFQFYAGGQLICGLAGYQMQLDLTAYAGNLLAKVLVSFQRALPTLLKVNTLIIGTPVSAGLTAIFHPNIKHDQLRRVAKCLISYAQEQKIQIVLVRDFNRETHPFEQALPAARFERLQNFPLASMEVPWSDFESYLAAMKGRYRYDARRRLKRKTAQAVETCFCQGMQAMPYNQQYVALYRHVLERSNEFPHELIGEDYHQAMATHLGQRSYWLNDFQGEQLVAFLHFIHHQKRIIAQYIGLDYQVSEAGQLYFNAFYDLIHFAIQHGVTRIEAGVSSYPAKSSLGFSILPQRMYFWHRNKLLRSLVPRAFEALSRFDLDQCHNIFKDPALQSLPDSVRPRRPEQ